MKTSRLFLAVLSACLVASMVLNHVQNQRLLRQSTLLQTQDSILAEHREYTAQLEATAQGAVLSLRWANEQLRADNIRLAMVVNQAGQQLNTANTHIAVMKNQIIAQRQLMDGIMGRTMCINGKPTYFIRREVLVHGLFTKIVTVHEEKHVDQYNRFGCAAMEAMGKDPRQALEFEAEAHAAEIVWLKANLQGEQADEFIARHIEEVVEALSMRFSMVDKDTIRQRLDHFQQQP